MSKLREYRYSDLFIIEDIINMGYINKLKIFLKQNVVNKDTMLLRGSSEGYSRIVTYSLRYNLSMNELMNKSLYLASSRGHDNIIKILKNYGVDISSNNNQALQYAFMTARISTVLLLISYGVNDISSIGYNLISVVKLNKPMLTKIIFQYPILEFYLKHARTIACSNSNREIRILLDSHIAKSKIHIK
jgi:ankyrin repeat protein